MSRFKEWFSDLPSKWCKKLVFAQSVFAVFSRGFLTYSFKKPCILCHYAWFLKSLKGNESFVKYTLFFCNKISVIFVLSVLVVLFVLFLSILNDWSH